MTVATERFTFTKDERLSSRKIIAELYEKGKSFIVFPFRLVWLETILPSAFPVQIVLSVPSKNFRKAVDRNRIKRQMREVYRKNKSAVYSLLQKEKNQCAIMIIFTGKSKVPFNEIENKLKLTLLRFEESYKKNAE